MNAFRGIQLCLMLVVIVASACKPKAASDLNAVVSADGQKAFGLILLRNYYEPKPGVLFEDDALKVENALRLQLALVECTGADSARQVNFLETLAFNNPDLLRRDGTQIVTITPNDRTEIQGCQAIGKHVVGPATFVELFNEAPGNEGDFLAQQTLWLSIRGRPNLGTKTFGVQFYNWLGENLGAMPNKGFDDIAVAVAAMDALYNPCIKANSQRKGFDKGARYLCDERSNYQVKGNYETIRGELSQRVDRIEAGFLASLAKQGSEAVFRSEGLEVALTVGKTIAHDVQFSGKTQQSLVDLSSDPELEYEGSYPVIDMLRGRSEVFQRVFRIKLGKQPSPVFSFSNPRSVDTPPDLDDVEGIAESQGDDVQPFGLDDGFGLRRVRRNWSRSIVRPNYYYAQTGNYQGHPVYTTQSVGSTSNGRSASSSTQWIYMGKTSYGTLMWKRPNDSAIYHTAAESPVRRTTTNATPPTKVAQKTSGWNGYYGKTQSPIHEDPRKPFEQPKVERPRTPEQVANDKARESFKESLGWSKEQLGGMEAHQFINQRGNVLPNFDRFTTGTDPNSYRMNKEWYDKNKYDGTRFNCQDFTATDIQGYYETTGIRASSVSISWDDPSHPQAVEGRLHHAVGLYPVGTDAEGRKLYRFKDSLSDPSHDRNAEAFPWDGKDPKVIEQQIAKQYGYTGVQYRGKREYDPKVGAKSTIQSPAKTTYGEEKRANGDKVYANGKPGEEEINWVNVPDSYGWTPEDYKKMEEWKKTMADLEKRERVVAPVAPITGLPGTEEVPGLKSAAAGNELLPATTGQYGKDFQPAEVPAVTFDKTEFGGTTLTAADIGSAYDSPQYEMKEVVTAADLQPAYEPTAVAATEQVAAVQPSETLEATDAATVAY